MGFGDMLSKIFKTVENSAQVGKSIEKLFEQTNNKSNNSNNQPTANKTAVPSIICSDSSRVVEDTFYGDEDKKYSVSFTLNDSFKEAQSHAGEVEMLYTYAPNSEYGDEGASTYIAFLMDECIYQAVDEFKKSGKITKALEITPLNGKFFFKAKMNYYNSIVYFYGLDRCDGFWNNNGLCLVYPKEYLNTENEAKLQRVLDEVAQTYNEQLNQ